MGRVLAKTVAVYDTSQGKSVTYLAGDEIPDEVAAGITNEKVFADKPTDTSVADAAAYKRSFEAVEAGRPLRVLNEAERRAWAYEPESEAGIAAEAKLVEAEGGDPAPTGPGPDPADPDPADPDPADPEPVSDAPEPPRGGPGSGVSAWRAYAEAKGFTVPAEADRDGIMAIVDAAK